MTFTKDERTLILLYYEDDRATTIRNLTAMQGQLQPDEKELCMLTGLVLDKLSSMTDQQFERLDLFGETG